MFRFRLTLLASALGLTLLGSVAVPIAGAAGDANVTIVDAGDATAWGYTPASTSITAGQTITWTNSGVMAHDAASTDGSWKTALLNNGASDSVTFSTPGTYTYICTPHPWMQATVVVTAAVSLAPPPVDPGPPAADPPADGGSGA